MSRFGEYLRIKKHKGEKYTPLCPEVCARLLKNQESIRKNILLLLVLILSPMVCYSEIPTEIEKPLKTEVRLGYEPNYFSPTNDLHVKNDTIASKKVEDNKEECMSVGEMVWLAFMQAGLFYLVNSGIIFIIITILGCISLMIAKIIQVYRKKR